MTGGWTGDFISSGLVSCSNPVSFLFLPYTITNLFVFAALPPLPTTYLDLILSILLQYFNPVHLAVETLRQCILDCLWIILDTWHIAVTARQVPRPNRLLLSRFRDCERLLEVFLSPATPIGAVVDCSNKYTTRTAFYAHAEESPVPSGEYLSLSCFLGLFLSCKRYLNELEGD